MAGVFDIDLTVHRKPAGHGYAEMIAGSYNPYFGPGTIVRGHEFHYSAPTLPLEDIPARRFLAERRVEDRDCRFDVIAILHRPGCRQVGQVASDQAPLGRELPRLLRTDGLAAE